MSIGNISNKVAESESSYIEVTVRVVTRKEGVSTQVGEHKRAHMELDKPEYTGLSRWVMENAISLRMSNLFHPTASNEEPANDT